MSDVTRTNAAQSSAANMTDTIARSRTVVVMTPAALVAMCAEGMDQFDREVSKRTSAQRDTLDRLSKFNDMGTQMAKFRSGVKTDDGKLRCAPKEWGSLMASYLKQMGDPDPEIRETAKKNAHELIQRPFIIDEGTGARLSEEIDSQVSDITSRQQSDMAQINDLMSKRSNLVEMAKNLVNSLYSQQEFITKNPAR